MILTGILILGASTLSMIGMGPASKAKPKIGELTRLIELARYCDSLKKKPLVEESGTQLTQLKELGLRRNPLKEEKIFSKEECAALAQGLIATERKIGEASQNS